MGVQAIDAKAHVKLVKRKGKFKASSNAEAAYYKQLKKVAKAASNIVGAHVLEDGASLKDQQRMMSELDEYAKKITPWATKQATKMLEQVSRSNKRAYNNKSKAMGQLLRSSVAERAEGDVALALLYEQVGLIQSIPLEAGFRAQKIAAENFFNGTRAAADPELVKRLMAERRTDITMHNMFSEMAGTKELAEEMSRTEEVAINRAKLIARTETARANASFVQARASAVGVTSYIWRTSMDGAERKSHGEMNGKVVQYDKPPKLSDGTVGHAGTFPNCRCFQDPILPDLE